MAEDTFDHRDALKRAMEALEGRNRIAVVRGRAKASTTKDASDELKANAALDAKAWNTLKQLGSIL